VELAKMKLTVTREELKSGQPEVIEEPCEGKIDLPVEELILRILHRLITESRE
jgi:hypothetical protein